MEIVLIRIEIILARQIACLIIVFIQGITLMLKVNCICVVPLSGFNEIVNDY